MPQFASKYLLILLIPGILAACAGMPSENSDPSKNNKAQWRKDLTECKEDYPELGSGVHIKQWIGCMNLKGWQ